MWIIGMAVCIGLMLAGHAFTTSAHSSHSHEGAVQESVATAPGRAPANAAPEEAPQPEPEPEHHH
jgi:hypothetical protein